MAEYIGSTRDEAKGNRTAWLNIQAAREMKGRENMKKTAIVT